MWSSVALLTICVTLANAQILANKACNQDIKPINFLGVASKVKAVVFSEQRRYPVSFEIDSWCNTAIFDYDILSILGFRGTAEFSLIFTNGTAYTLKGDFVFKNILKAEGDVTLPDIPGKGSVSVIASGGDNVDWALAYNCVDIGNQQSLVYVWLVTRAVNPDQSIINAGLTAMRRMNLDTAPLLISNQTNCG